MARIKPEIAERRNRQIPDVFTCPGADSSFSSPYFLPPRLLGDAYFVLFFVRGVAFIGITAPLDNSLSCYEVCGSTILKENKCGGTLVSVAPPAEGADNQALEDNSHPSRNLNPF